MTNELNDLWTRGVETRSQTWKVGMSDEKARHKKEAEKVEVKTQGQTQKVGMSDEEAHHKKEVETWGQTQKAFEKEMSDDEDNHKTRGMETQGQTEKVRMSDGGAHH